MKKSRLFIAAPIVAAAMFVASPTFAAGYDGNGVTTSATEAVAGAEVTFSATGFKPNSQVTVTLSSSSLSIDTTADAAGAVSVTVVVPEGITPGEYVLTAQGVDPSGAPRIVSAPVTIADEMPNTGSSSSPLQIIALASAATAAGVVLLKRRSA